MIPYPEGRWDPPEVAVHMTGVPERIYDGLTWRRVVRVNAKSVTVATAYSWIERVPIKQVHAYC